MKGGGGRVEFLKFFKKKGGFDFFYKKGGVPKVGRLF